MSTILTTITVSKFAEFAQFTFHSKAAKAAWSQGPSSCLAYLVASAGIPTCPAHFSCFPWCSCSAACLHSISCGCYKLLLAAGLEVSVTSSIGLRTFSKGNLRPRGHGNFWTPCGVLWSSWLAIWRKNKSSQRDRCTGIVDSGTSSLEAYLVSRNNWFSFYYVGILWHTHLSQFFCPPKAYFAARCLQESLEVFESGGLS